MLNILSFDTHFWGRVTETEDALEIVNLKKLTGPPRLTERKEGFLPRAANRIFSYENFVSHVSASLSDNRSIPWGTPLFLYVLLPAALSIVQHPDLKGPALTHESSYSNH